MKQITPSFDLTHQNSLKFGFNGSPFSIRTSEDDHWFASYSPVSRKPLSFREECINTVKLIRSKTDKTIYVMYSGGVDSEVVLDSVISAKISNWKIFVLNYDNRNEYDLLQVEKYLKYRGIDPRKIIYHGFNVKDYWESADIITDMKDWGSISPQFPVYVRGMLHVSKELGGYPITGSAECYFERRDGELVMFEREKVATLYRGLYLNDCEGCAGFFQYTPELIASWILDPEFERIILNNKSFTESLSLKHEIYMRHFDFPPRIKKTGFEFHRGVDHELRREIMEFPELAQDQVQFTRIEDLKSQLGC